jgi:hypothetical protein
MKRTRLVIAISVAFLSAALTQSQVLAASIEMSIVTTTETGTTTYTAPCPLYETYSDGREVWKIGYSPDDEGYTWPTPEGEVSLRGILDPDPMINIAGGAIDFGAPSNFGFIFLLPLSPDFSNPSIVKDSFSGSVTNAAGPGVTVTALAPPAGIPVDADGITEIEVYTLSDDDQFSWQNVGLDLMPTTVVPLGIGASGNTPSFNEGPIATIAGGPWTDMRADINFRLSGGGDLFTFNGAKILVPEPGTLVLALLSSAGIRLLRRRVRT